MSSEETWKTLSFHTLQITAKQAKGTRPNNTPTKWADPKLSSKESGFDAKDLWNLNSDHARVPSPTPCSVLVQECMQRAG